MAKSKGKPKDAVDGKPPIDKKGGKNKGPGQTGRKSRRSVDGLAEKKKSVPEEQPNEAQPPPAPKTESFKFLDMEPEWNSEEIRNHQLLADGFTCCTVLVMEDSAELTAMGHYLHHAVKTGVRKRFISISGEEVAVKVKKFLTSTRAREPGKDDQDFWERMDIWAEAVKQMLIRVKAVVVSEQSSKEVELTGARSKDLVRQMPPIGLSTGPEEAEEEDVPPPPVPPPSAGEKVTTPKAEGEERSKKKKGAKDDKRKSVSGTRQSKHNQPDAPPSSVGTKARSNMRKRGELPMPTLEEVDDSPPKGPQTFVLLQGFYNPKILEELQKIGVPVDGILLMTDEKVTKRNFSVLDIEDSIPGTFRPNNIHPNYLKYVEHQNAQPRNERDVVGQFWAALADLYNTTPPDSPLLDCALMNFALPQTQFGLDSPEARGIYASKLFDEASQRIYEMVVLRGWFQDYKSSATLKQILPAAEEVPRPIYDELLNQVPAECVTVPLIMECILEQVVADVENPNTAKTAGDESKEESPEEKKRQEEVEAEHQKFGRPDWGNTVLQGGLKALSKQNIPQNQPPKPPGPAFAPPLYIKNGDYASIRSCHLRESVAAHIASTQVAGDLRNVQGILWQSVPEFNKGLYMKLLANLNHFMYFLPPESVSIEDMFFILHLLMSAGVEVQLQRQPKSVTSSKETKTQNVQTTNSQQAPENPKSIDGTRLDKGHNYLAVNDPTGVQFILAPTSDNEIKVAPSERAKKPETEEGLKVEKVKKKKKKDKIEPEEPPKDKKDEAQVENTPTNPDSSKRRSVTYEDEEGTKRKSLKDEEPTRKSLDDDASKRRSSGTPRKSILITDDAKKSADIAIQNAIKDAAELVNNPDLSTIEEEENEHTEEEMEEKQQVRVPDPLDTYYFGADVNASKSKRFIACEQEWFKDLNDYSVFQSLLECPALLAISDTGALDLSTWIKTYLLSAGLSRGSGDGVLIGPLKDWNYVEELVPVQMIQLLNESMSNYNSMQRMYCPFYDTLLFIFNNPIPKELKSDTQYYYKLRTLPGLQHFLEYGINDDNVLQWLMGIERYAGAEIIDTLSVTTLMKIVPEEQWLLVPSIKYMLYQEQAKLSEPAGGIPAVQKDIQPEEINQMGDMPDKRGSLKEEQVTPEGDVPGSGSNHTDEGEQGKGKSRRKSKTQPKRSSRKSKDISSPEEDAKLEEEKKRGSKASTVDLEEGKHKEKRRSRQSGQKGSRRSTDASGLPDLPGSAEHVPESAKLDSIPSFHFNDAITSNRQSSIPKNTATPAPRVTGPRFNCYDLGKRVMVAAADTYNLFPMDGSVIQYDISTIEPEFRMMQLTITKNGHQTFFYPYYIPQDFVPSTDSYVICPYFHMVHANGAMFAFQDLRAVEPTPYTKVSKKGKEENINTFSYEKVIFGSEIEGRKQRNSGDDTPEKRKRQSVKPAAATTVVNITEKTSSGTTPPLPLDAEIEGEGIGEEQEEMPDDGKDAGKKGKKPKAKKDKQKDDQDKTSDIKEKAKRGKSEKKLKKGRKSLTSSGDLGEGEENKDETLAAPTEAPEATKPQAQDVEWVYSDSEPEEEMGDGFGKRKTQSYYAPNWDQAEMTMEPMTHLLKITLPSGLLIQVDNVPGPPISREVKQTYTARGSATSRVETSRYYTMNGSVVKFMLNGTIQILTARGVTTTIRELASSSQRDEENLQAAFVSSENVRIFNGDVILPNGDFWHIVDGKKAPHDPIFVFTSGPLANGEIFRRRQDGVIYLHRHDGTTITHYPDGTRFTTRMVVLKDPVEEFEDWVFVGLKYMVEHANYSTVIFNTLSGNVHIRLPQGIWTRVFADGSVKLSTIDNYTLDVDKSKAVLSYPPSPASSEDIPNLTSVKLWHSKDQGPAAPKLSLPKVPEVIVVETEPVPEETIEKPEEDKDALKPSTSTAKIRPSVSDMTKTRGRSGSSVGGQPNLRKSVAVAPPDTLDIPQEGKAKRLSVEGIDGEPLEEEAAVNDAIASTVEPEEAEEIQPLPERNAKSSKKFEIQEFLQFGEGSLFCKAVDSWDNRFAVDLYGETFVDKGMEAQPDATAEQLLRSFAEHCNLPQEYISGILRMTSSDDLGTAAKRIAALKQAPAEPAGNLPGTKMFVVKRDLSGYEYLKKSQVDMLTARAKGCRDSMVIVDPLPNREPRKFITIMEPITEIDKPRGMWTNIYREPAFRPRLLTNKHLQVSKFEDLRWFGYVLMSAHGKKPKFFPTPRDLYLKKKASNERSKQPAVTQAKLSVEQEQENVQEAPVVEEVETAEKVKGKDKTKSKSGKKEKVKKEKSATKDIQPQDTTEDPKPLKKRKSQSKKHTKSGKTKGSTSPAVDNTEQLTPASPKYPEEEGEEPSKEPQKKPISLEETDVGSYPEDMPDLEGIYEDQEPVKVMPQHHADILTQKKAVIVRSFVEIPQVNDKLQRALLAASLSYGQTVQNQIDVFKANSIQDPRSEEEKEHQKIIKQQLIEQNLSDMHLLEQRSGAVLRFHF